MSEKVDKFNIKIARAEYKYENKTFQCYFCKEMGHKTHTKWFVTCPKLKNKKCNIICPGYLLEAFMCLLAYDVLVLSGLKMDRIIMPEQYNGMAKLFGYDNLKTSKQEEVYYFIKIEI